MKKHLVIPIVVLLMVALGSPAMAATDAVGLVVNGQAIVSDVPAQIVNGRTLVPVRFVSEALGARVSWDAETQTAVIESPGFTAAASLADLGAGNIPGIKVVVDGQLVDSDVPAQIISGRTMVPVRFVSEALGATVAWNNETRTVRIDQRQNAVNPTLTTPTGTAMYDNGRYRFSYPADWKITETDTGVQVEPVDLNILLEIHGFVADPFINSELLTQFYATSLKAQLGGTALETVPGDATAATVGTYSADNYIHYRIPLTDGGSLSLQQWAVEARGQNFLVDLISGYPAYTTDPAVLNALTKADAVLASFQVTADSTLEYQAFGDSDLGLTVTFPASWGKYVDLGTMVGFGNGAGTSVVLAVQQVAPGTTASQLLETNRAQISSMYSSDVISFEGDGPASMAGADDARVLYYQLKMGGLAMHGEQYHLVRGDKGYIVTVTLLDGFQDEPGIRQAIQDLLDSVKIGQ